MSDIVAQLFASDEGITLWPIPCQLCTSALRQAHSLVNHCFPIAGHAEPVGAPVPGGGREGEQTLDGSLLAAGLSAMANHPGKYWARDSMGMSRYLLFGR